MSTKIKHILCLIVSIFMMIVVVTSVVDTMYQLKQYNLIKKSIEKLQVETEVSTIEKPIEDKNKEEIIINETEIVETEQLEIEVEQPVVDSVDYDVPSYNTIKSYMDYRFITATDSRQYQLQYSLAQTDNNGLRVVNGRYCVALGSYYTTTIGQYVDIELENGNVIEGILADCKADIHTDLTNRINPNGSVVEFIVDTDLLDGTAKTMGDISYLNGWNSKVVNIKVYDKIENF